MSEKQLTNTEWRCGNCGGEFTENSRRQELTCANCLEGDRQAEKIVRQLEDEIERLKIAIREAQGQGNVQQMWNRLEECLEDGK